MRRLATIAVGRRLATIAVGTWPEIGMLAITAIFAVCFTAIRAGLADAPPLLFGGFRWGVSR